MTKKNYGDGLLAKDGYPLGQISLRTDIPWDGYPLGQITPTPVCLV